MAIFNTVPPLAAGAGIKFDGERISTAAAPRNLLDNSDFRNPVNQRGTLSYTQSGYTIDRWKNWNASSPTKVNTGYVHFTNSQQYIGPPVDIDATYTAAAKRKDGTLILLSGTFSGKPNSGGLRMDYDTESDGEKKFYVAINVAGDYLWAALYEGEYTVETLPEYQSKGYGAELAECQKYFLRQALSRPPVAIIANNSICFNVLNTMRTRPSLAFNASPSWLRCNGIQYTTDGAALSVFNLGPNQIAVSINVSGTPYADIQNCVGYLSNCIVDFSADL